jgi:hypothetical protein
MSHCPNPLHGKRMASDEAQAGGANRPQAVASGRCFPIGAFDDGPSRPDAERSVGGSR